MEAIVHFDEVSKLFDGKPAVEALSLSLIPGEFFSLLGPSGCGKTTTLRLIAGFEQPDSGQVFIAGENVSGVPPYKRNVNTVFQSYALFPHLNVFENVAFGLRRQKLPDEIILQRVSESLALVHLVDFEKRKVQQLSGGQQQRVALARALVNKPSVLLLDEPMAALDSQLKRNMRRELKSLQRKLGITFVLVTHDQEEALTMSDRVAVLLNGRLQQVSPPEELYRHPTNRFVAEFIGRANFLPVERSGKDLRFQDTILRSTSNDEIETACWMIRPESLRIGEPEEGENSVSGVLTDSTFVGPIVRHQVSLSPALDIIVESSSRKDAQPALGPVQVNWSPDCGKLLPDETDT